MLDIGEGKPAPKQIKSCLSKSFAFLGIPFFCKYSQHHKYDYESSQIF